MKTPLSHVSSTPDPVLENTVELHRRFVDAEDPHLKGASDEDVFGYIGLLGRLKWPDLHRSSRVVLLEEGRAGKTVELQREAARIRAAGDFAFFVPLEALATAGIPHAIWPPGAADFERWRSGNQTATFFLDAVDEMRLNRHVFTTALNTLRQDLGDAYSRARFIISCRPSDWHWEKDLAAIRQMLPVITAPVVGVAESTKNDEEVMLETLFDPKPQPRRRRPGQAAQPEPDEPRVVLLAPLKYKQWKVLAGWRGVPDPDAFVRAISRHNLAGRAERPGDLLELCDHWKTQQRFAARRDMTEASVRRNLTEELGRPASDAQLTPQRARQGAERLAGALVLGQSLIILNDAEGMSLAAGDPLLQGAIDPTQVLHDWTPGERQALLRLPLFAPATYGRTRFHQRDDRDFLAACWLRRLYQDQVDPGELRSLLFAEVYGEAIVIPGMGAVAAWLALDDIAIAEELLRRNFLALVQFGDPGSLPLPARQRLLELLVDHEAQQRRELPRLEDPQLRLLAQADLAPTILAQWPRARQSRVWVELLRIAALGALEACLPLARAVLANLSEPWYGRHVALELLEACGQRADLQQEARALLSRLDTENTYHLTSAAQLLFPDYLTVPELTALLKSVWERDPQRHRYFHEIEPLYQACGTAAQRRELGAWLADLALAEPFRGPFHRVSLDFGSLATTFGAVALQALQEHSLDAPPEYAIRLCMAMEREGSVITDDRDPLAELIGGNLPLKRKLMWADIDEYRRSGPHFGNTAVDPLHLSINSPLWHLGESDIPWLLEEVDARADEADRIMMFTTSIRVAFSSLQAWLPELQACAALHPPLPEILAHWTAPREPSVADLSFEAEQEKNRTRRNAEQEKNKQSWRVFRAVVSANPATLYDPVKLRAWPSGQSHLKVLTDWLQIRCGRADYQVTQDWPHLDRAFGTGVGEAYRQGLRTLWRVLTSPSRPHREPNLVSRTWPDVLALHGIALEAAEDPQWAHRLSPDEAALAMHHLVTSEESQAERILPLLEAQPAATATGLLEGLGYEFRSTLPGVDQLLRQLNRDDTPLPAALGALLPDLYTQFQPGDLSRLDLANALLAQATLIPRAQQGLVRLLSQRVRQNASNADWCIAYLCGVFALDVGAGVAALNALINTRPARQRKKAAQALLAGLLGKERNWLMSLSRASVAQLEKLIRLICLYVPEMPESGNSPDHPAHRKNQVTQRLLDRGDAAAFAAVRRLVKMTGFWWPHDGADLLRRMATRDGARGPWSNKQVAEFEANRLAPANSGAELLEAVMRSLRRIREALLNADGSTPDLLAAAVDEDPVRRWLQERLNESARGRFKATQEAMVANGKFPDLLVAASPAIENAIEVKHGNKPTWTVRTLEKTLRKQLSEQYLRPRERRHGILFILLARPRTWEHPVARRTLSFAQLIEHLEKVAAKVLANDTGEVSLRVFGLDVSAHYRPPGKPKRKPQPKKQFAGRHAAPSKRIGSNLQGRLVSVLVNTTWSH